METHRVFSGNRFRVGSSSVVWVAALILLLVVVPVFAQLATGSILGVVKDTSGGVVPDARVTVINVETSQSRTVTTGSDGAYRVPGLTAGHYTVKVEKEGFQTQTQQSLVLDVSQELVVNASLTVGSSSQEVTVTGEAPLVNTTSSSLGGLVNEHQMTDLPLNGRNYMDLSLLQPGVSRNTSMGSSHGTGGVWYSSNGAPTRANIVTLDGANMMTLFGSAATSQAGTTLGLDGIREYKVVTTSFSAEYGQSMGSQMLMVSKGGTNQWHGDVFEYLRNAALDARNFFDRQYLVPDSGITRLPPFQRNNFGGAFGGPIKKDKTFFYAAYEGLRQNLGFTALDTVPRASCHNLTKQLDGTYRFDTLAYAQDCGGSGTTLTNNTVIPAVMVPLLNLYPVPNISSTQFTFPTTNRASVNWGQIRFDQNFSAEDTFFARYTLDDTNLNNGNTSLGNASSGVAFPQFGVRAESRNQFLTLAENHVFTATVLNTVRLSFSRTHSLQANTYTPLPGQPALDDPQYQLISGLPMGIIAITGIDSLGGQSGFGPPDDTQIQNIYTLSDDLYYTRGKHALKFGTLINRYNQGMTGALRNEGQINFSNMQSFLLGKTNTRGYVGHPPFSLSDANRYYLFNTFGFYAQDDWRATSRLTLNLGLRYEFMTTPNEANNRSYALRNVWSDAATTQGQPFENYSLHNFSPRVGFAFDPMGNGKTSIRGAFGIYYDVGNVGVTLEQALLGTPPLITTCTVASATITSLPLEFKNGNCATAFTNQYDAQQPHTLQYNLTVERQLPGSIGLTVSYVGLRGIHLYTNKEGNPVRLPDPTINTYLVDGVKYWGSNVLNCANVVPSCRMNPNFAAMQYVATAGDSFYNSLQVVVNKRLSHGIEFTSSYTWSKDLDTTEANMDGNECGSGVATGLDPLNMGYDKGPACWDAKHNWRFSALYHLPNLKSNGFAAKVVNGWWVGNIVSVQSGYPFTPLLTSNRSQSGVFQGLTGTGERPNLVTAATAGPGTGGASSVTFVPYDPNTVITGDPNHWFNPLMFNLAPMVPCPGNAAVTCGVLGNVTRGFLRAPGLGNWDLSVVKDTKLGFLGEQGSVQFRAEFFNILNRANFGFPSTSTYSGSPSDVGANSEKPSGSAGRITTTSTTSRQIQLALKIIF
jgi:hypothetical protein